MSKQNKSKKKLKILCVADHIDNLVYSVNAKKRFKDIDLVLSAGDLPMTYLGFIASTLNRPLLFVFGNHNLSRLNQFKNPRSISRNGVLNVAVTTNYFGSTYIEDNIVKRKGLLIAGLGGSIRYNNGEHQYTDFQMTWRIIRLIPKLLFNRIFRGRYLDILVTHAAPYGINDKDDPCHRGFKSFLWFMKRFKPQYLLHGHIHLYDFNAKRTGFYEDTEIINVYDHYILEIDTVEQ